MRLRGTLLALSLVVLAGTGCAADEEESSVEGVETADYPGGVHTSGEIDYAETPPRGGQHDPQWLACGVYDRPVREENAVHTLAWNRKLPLDQGADDPGLDAFLDEYADGHTAPEASIGCQPGVARFEDE